MIVFEREAVADELFDGAALVDLYQSSVAEQSQSYAQPNSRLNRFKGWLMVTPAVVGLEMLKEDLKNTAIAADWSESQSKVVTAASGTAAIAVLAAGAAKLPTFFGPTEAMNLAESTHNPRLTGLIIGAAFGTWTLWSSRAVARATEKFPHTFNWANNYKGDNKAAKAAAFILRNFSSGATSLPGFYIDRPEDSAKPLMLQALKDFSTHTGRGLAATLATTAGYVGAANMEGHSQEEIYKLTNRLGLDAAIVTAIGSGAIAQVMLQTIHSHPEIAHDIDYDMRQGFRNTAVFIGFVGLKHLIGRLRSR